MVEEPYKKEEQDGEGHVLVIRERNIVQVPVLEAGDKHSVRATGYKSVCFSLSKLSYSFQGELLPNPNNVHNPGNHFLALSTYISSSPYYGEIRYSTNTALCYCSFLQHNLCFCENINIHDTAFARTLHKEGCI